MFCERRCALVHLEQAWAENVFTAEGRLSHERAHETACESRGAERVARGLRLRSLKLGLAGMADVVEFHKQPDGSWLPFPVEYKRGKPKDCGCDRVQLCAQAICLEEMLGVKIREGALFYGRTRRRQNVEFSPELRAETADAAFRFHKLIENGSTPPADYSEKCESCSLMSLCLPKKLQAGSVRKYMEQLMNEKIP